VGLGAKGDGVQLLDDPGINYDDGDYHVVDLNQKKVVSSAAGKKGDDNRHIVALESWRQQPDLLSAIIGISEDPATREPVHHWLPAIAKHGFSRQRCWRG
jgi:hypothetical protein